MIGNASFQSSIRLDRLHELIGDEQREIELSQSAGFALGANEIHCVRMTDVERAHLRAAPAARRRHREAHLVVDIHERERAGCVRARARNVCAARPHRRKLIADAAARLQREPGFVDLRQDVVHRVEDRAGHRAVDRRRRRLVLLRAGVRHDAPGRDRALAQRPQKLFVPVLAHLLAFDVGERAGYALVRLVHRAVDRLTVLGAQSILLVPDIERGLLKGNAIDVHRLNFDCSCFHAGMSLRGCRQGDPQRSST